MSMPSFQMSRTGKILIGVLLAAAAIFFWVNFFVQDTPPEATQPTPAPTAAASVPGAEPAPADDATDADATEGDAPAVEAESDAAPDAATDAGEGPAVAVDVPQPEVATRDLVVADLPFLITEPVQTAGTDGGADGDGATGADRPGTALRATIKPFAPVVRPVQPAAAASAPAPASGADVTEVEVPEAPEVEAAAAPEPVVAPAPAALAPPSPLAGTLPRALPGGTLPSTPALLRGPRRAPDTPAIRDVIDATAAGVRVPGAPAPRLEAAERDATADALSDDDLAPIDRMATDGDPRSTDADPLAAGVTPLSAYLRDNNVTFTGAVLGPVSVGVFRAANRTNPIVVALGSSLPDTDIVLTDLTGSQAQFSQDEAQQILSLNLRR